jgi:hypothetical protein
MVVGLVTFLQFYNFNQSMKQGLFELPLVLALVALKL